ncbi:DMT family transporter [Peribacillus glennii]|uniref:DMT family transporter n=1 Tax=Peribacillus glennii TaxID=2303991 RepID=A0A372LD66_9BACI|nr:DMT family transporter [Peribacillus glennii]RFU63703.1 DMT family transporter [Peribacillus glennii]
MQEPMFNPYLALAIGVASVSASAILVKFSTAPSAVIAFYRLLFSVCLTIPFLSSRNIHELLKLGKKDFCFSILAGVFLAFHFILWFESLDYTSVASSTVLVTLQPLFAFVGAFLFFKDRVSIRTILSGIIAIGGSIVIGWGDLQISGLALWGDVLALIACALVTGYLLFGQSVRKRISSVTYTFVVYTVSTVTLLLYVILTGESLAPYPAADWIYFVLLAVFPNLLGHSLFNWSLKWLSTTTISMAILMEPIGASILAYLLLGEKIVWTQGLGGFVIIAGLIMYLKNENKMRAANDAVSGQNKNDI